MTDLEKMEEMLDRAGQKYELKDGERDDELCLVIEEAGYGYAYSGFYAQAYFKKLTEELVCIGAYE